MAQTKNFKRNYPENMLADAMGISDKEIPYTDFEETANYLFEHIAPKYVEPLKMYYQEKLSLSEIANRTGRNFASNVSSMIGVAINLMSKGLNGYYLHHGYTSVTSGDAKICLETRIKGLPISASLIAVINDHYRFALGKYDIELEGEEDNWVYDLITCGDVFMMYQTGEFISDYEERIYEVFRSLGFSEEDIVGHKFLMDKRRNEILSTKKPVVYKINERFPFNFLTHVFGERYIDITKIGEMDNEWELSSRIYDVLTTLPKRTAEVLLMRSIDHFTYDEVAAVIGVTRERARQIESKGYRLLRNPKRARRLRYGWKNELAENDKYWQERVASLEEQLQPKEDPEISPEEAQNNEEIQKIMNIPLAELEFTVRTYNCLCRHGIKVLGDLIYYTEDDILRIRNLGRKSAEEVINKMTAYGLHLADEDKVKQAEDKYKNPEILADDDRVAAEIIKIREEAKAKSDEYYAKAEADRAESERIRNEARLKEIQESQRYNQLKGDADEILSSRFPDFISEKLAAMIINLKEDERIIAVLLRTERFDPSNPRVSPFYTGMGNLTRGQLQAYDHRRLAQVAPGHVERERFVFDDKGGAKSDRIQSCENDVDESKH